MTWLSTTRVTSTSMCGLLLLLLSLVASSHANCNSLVPENVTDGENQAGPHSHIKWAPVPVEQAYENVNYTHGSGLSGMYYDTVSKFTHMLFGDEFPYDKLMLFVDTGELDYTGLMSYAMGLTVCLGICACMIVGTPCGGLAWFCMRMSGGCDGDRRWSAADSRSSRSNCMRYSLGLLNCLFIVTIGAVKVVQTVEDIGATMTDTGPETFQASLSDVATFLSNAINQTEYYFQDRYEFYASVMNRDLDNTAYLLGSPVVAHVESVVGVGDILSELKNQELGYQALWDNLVLINQTQEETVALQDQLDTEIQDLLDEFLAIKANVYCLWCGHLSLVMPTWLARNFDPTQLPNLKPADYLPDMNDFQNSLAQDKDNYAELCDNIDSLTYSLRKDLKSDINTSLETLVQSLEDRKANADHIFDTVDAMSQAEPGELWDLVIPVTPFEAGMILSGLIFVIVALSLLGWMCGCVGYDQHVNPMKRSDISSAGGNSLLGSACCFFVFGWILTAVTAALFVGSATLYGAACRELSDTDLTYMQKLLDEPNTPVEVKEVLQYSGTGVFRDSTLSDILKGCQQDNTIGSILVNQTQFDDYLQNLNHVTNYRKQQFESALNMSGRTVIQNGTLTFLKDFQYGTQQILPDLELYWPEIDEPLLNIPSDVSTLCEYGGKLRLHIFIYIYGEVLQERFDNATYQMDSICNSTHKDLLESQAKLKDLVVQLNTTVNSVGALSDLVTKTELTQTLFSQNINLIISQELDDFFKRLSNTTSTFLDGASESVQSVIGRCKPIWHFYKSIIIDVLCDGLILEVCGIWFGMGGSLAFLTLATYFSIKLTKHFLVMEIVNNFDGLDPTFEPVHRVHYGGYPSRGKNRVYPMDDYSED